MRCMICLYRHYLVQTVNPCRVKKGRETSRKREQAELAPRSFPRGRRTGKAIELLLSKIR